jgi:hypothetical protein
MEGSLEARPGVLLVGTPGVGKRTILSREISLTSFIFLSLYFDSKHGLDRVAKLLRVQIRCAPTLRVLVKEDEIPCFIF